MEIRSSSGRTGYADDLHSQGQTVPGDRRRGPRKTWDQARRLFDRLHAAMKQTVKMNMTTEPTPALENQKTSLLTDGMFIAVILALANFLMHVYFNNRYGYFPDEFDYMACGDHLAWGSVDQPPLIPFLIPICPAQPGDSLHSSCF